SPGGMPLRLAILPVGFSPSSRGLLPSRIASSERRRKFATLTPGIDIGYWNARKRRIRARRSGEYSKIFSPLNQISPSVTSYLGLHNYICQRTFARAVGSHKCVDFTLTNRQINST